MNHSLESKLSNVEKDYILKKEHELLCLDKINNLKMEQ